LATQKAALELKPLFPNRLVLLVEAGTHLIVDALMVPTK